MTVFEATTHAEVVVLAPQQDIWDVLVDPDLIARFTPFVKRIAAEASTGAGRWAVSRCRAGASRRRSPSGWS